MTPREREVLRVAGELEREFEREGLTQHITSLLETGDLRIAQTFLRMLLDEYGEDVLGQNEIARYHLRIGRRV